MGFLRERRAQAYLGRGRASLREGDYTMATWYFVNAIILSRTDTAIAEALRGLAYANIGKGDYEAAIRDFKASIESRPDCAECHYDLGVAYQHLGQTDEAIRCFEEAVRIRPHYPLPYNNIGVIWMGLERYRVAVEVFNRAISLDADFFEALYNLASAYLHLGDYAHAGETCTRLIQIRPDSPDARKMLTAIDLMQAACAEADASEN